MARKPKPVEPLTPEQHLRLLKRAAERCQSILTGTAAQHPDAPTMGTQLSLRMSAAHNFLGMEYVLTVPKDAVAVAAIQARTFTLERDELYIDRVVESITAVDRGNETRILATQIKDVWKRSSRARMRTFISQVDGGSIVDGVGDDHIADRVLYAKLVHADDASDLLDHISSEQQAHALAALAGDWIAYTANLEFLLNRAAPASRPALTVWAGDPWTMMHRLGVAPAHWSEALEQDAAAD